MRFESPWILLLLFLLPLLFGLIKNPGLNIGYSSLKKLKQIQAPRSIHPQILLLGLRALALILIILSLARPQMGKQISEIQSEGVDIILALDTSGSMQALDFQINNKRVTRLNMIQSVVTEFVKKRTQDRVGLVVFGEEAYTQCPLTLDHGVLESFIAALKIGMAGKSTAIGSAIGISVKRLEKLKSKSKIIVLLTDGSNTAGELQPIKAAELAQSLGIKIYTIGVGSNGKAPFLQDSFFGQRMVYQKVQLDEASLKSIAEITGGNYYRATETAQLRKIYDEIDRLETTEVKVKEYTQYSEKFHLFLIWGLILFMLELILSQTRLRVLP